MNKNNDFTHSIFHIPRENTHSPSYYNLVNGQVTQSHDFLDFNVPINLGFPTSEIMNAFHHILKSSSSISLPQHQDMLNLLNGYYYGEPNHIQLLNGASEGINIISRHIIKKRVLVITPNYET